MHSMSILENWHSPQDSTIQDRRRSPSLMEFMMSVQTSEWSKQKFSYFLCSIFQSCCCGRSNISYSQLHLRWPSSWCSLLGWPRKQTRTRGKQGNFIDINSSQFSSCCQGKLDKTCQNLQPIKMLVLITGCQEWCLFPVKHFISNFWPRQ